jgi:hypothetical protein
VSLDKGNESHRWRPYGGGVFSTSHCILHRHLLLRSIHIAGSHYPHAVQTSKAYPYRSSDLSKCSTLSFYIAENSQICQNYCILGAFPKNAFQSWRHYRLDRATLALNQTKLKRLHQNYFSDGSVHYLLAVPTTTAFWRVRVVLVLLSLLSPFSNHHHLSPKSKHTHILIQKYYTARQYTVHMLLYFDENLDKALRKTKLLLSSAGVHSLHVRTHTGTREAILLLLRNCTET